MPTLNVLSERLPVLTKADAKRLFSGALQRAVNAHGKGTVCDFMDVTPNTVNNAMSQTTLPELDTALNLLRLDHSAFDELLSHYGLKVVALDAVATKDARLLADVAGLSAVLADALADGFIDHREEQEFAEHARPLARELAARVAIADRKRAA